VKKEDQPLEPDQIRRRSLVLLGSVLFGTASYVDALAADDVASPMPTCLVTPEQTEGPFFIDTRSQRSDIRSDPLTGVMCPGVPLALTLRIHAVGNSSCIPMSNVAVDMWHCDASGHYSSVAQGRNVPANHGFLRGYQVTGTDGTVHFVTIYPGWYPGRAVHIHFKLRTKSHGNRSGEFTSQLYFDEGVTDIVHTDPIYRRRGRRNVLNTEDGLFANDGGERLLIKPVKTEGVYKASFDVGILV